MKSMPSPSLERARRLLGCVGMSPTPLTVVEAKQLICFSSGKMTKPPRVAVTVDLIKLCGPIIEIVGEYVFFVHFTAKE
jgi:hypothetical protein